MYLTYDEYQEMGGTLEKAAFDSFAFRAKGIIDKYTYSRLAKDSNIPYEVKRVMFDLISIQSEQKKALDLRGIALSQSNDGVSESRSAMPLDAIYTSLEKQMGEILTQGLTGVTDFKGHRLLYRGFYPDE